MQQNLVQLKLHGSVALLQIQGDITIQSELSLKDAYKGATEQGAGKLLMEFGESAYINSGGISVIIQLLAEARKNNQQIGITGISDHFKKIFGMVGITKFARIYTSAEEGMKDLAG
jgi:anti-anti-sigma factor